MFNPLNVIKRPARIEICYTLGNIIAAPFFVVKFRHFFLADVITSARLMLSDTTAMMCFYTSGEFTSSQPLTCMWATNLNYLWGMIPFWWRMLQCLRRYRDDRTNETQLWNALKYFISLMTGLSVMMYKLTGG